MKYIYNIVALLSLMSLVSCSKDYDGQKGMVKFRLSGDWDVVDITRSLVSDYAGLPSPEDFRVAVKDGDSQTVWTGMMSELASGLELLEGTYSVKAEYGYIDDEGFEKPYFVAEEDFVV